MTVMIGGARVEVVRGNIVDQHVDAIVNAANSSLLGGGGVDGAIHRAAGPALLEACRKLPTDVRGERCPAGEARTTVAGDLPARVVVHTVGPVYDSARAERSAALLRSAHLASLREAVSHGCRTVAFPGISTGAYGYPASGAAAVAMRAVRDFLTEQDHDLTLVRFVTFSEPHRAVYAAALGEAPAAE